MFVCLAPRGRCSYQKYNLLACLPYVLYFVRQMLLLCLVSQGKLIPQIVILVLINEKNVETHIVSKPGGLNPLQGLDVGVASPEALKHNHDDDFALERIAG